jgi:hypothetical protein
MHLCYSLEAFEHFGSEKKGVCVYSHWPCTLTIGPLSVNELHGRHL